MLRVHCLHTVTFTFLTLCAAYNCSFLIIVPAHAQPGVDGEVSPASELIADYCFPEGIGVEQLHDLSIDGSYFVQVHFVHVTALSLARS